MIVSLYNSFGSFVHENCEGIIAKMPNAYWSVYYYNKKLTTIKKIKITPVGAMWELNG